MTTQAKTPRPGRRAMRTLALALVLALALLAGCVKPTTETPASTDDPTVGTLSSPTPTTQPSPTAPTSHPSPSPSPNATASPASPTPPDNASAPPPAAAPPVVYSDAKSGWVAVGAPSGTPPDTNYTTTLPFPLAAGATSVQLTGNVTLVAPQDASQATTVLGATLSLVGPDGKTVKQVASSTPSPGAVRLALSVDASKLVEGTYKLVLVVQGGASDGSSAGDKWQVRAVVLY